MLFDLEGRKAAAPALLCEYSTRVALTHLHNHLSLQITKADLEQRHPQLDFVFTLAQNLKNKASSSDVRSAITEKCKSQTIIYSYSFALKMDNLPLPVTLPNKERN